MNNLFEKTKYFFKKNVLVLFYKLYRIDFNFFFKKNLYYKNIFLNLNKYIRI